MSKKIRIILALAVAVWVSFAVTEVGAQTFPPQTSQAGPYTISVDPDVFPLPIYSQADPNYDDFPCSSCTFPYYVYQYNIFPTSGISRIDQLIPVCETPIQVLATNPQNNLIYAPGMADSSIKWPSPGLYDSYVLAFAASPNSGKFWVATNTAGIAITSMTVKSGNKLYYGVNGIAGPGCQSVASFVPVNVTEDKMLGNICVTIVRDPATRCVKAIYPCGHPEQPFEEVPITVGGQSLVSCGTADGNQQCQECVIFAESSPGCYTYVSGGRAYLICH